MSSLPGNPHERNADGADGPHWALVQATLAVAFELRTANLIAHAVASAAPHRIDLMAQIGPRIGVEDDGR